MANKRKLKKAIDLVCGELFAECVIAAQCGGKTSSDDVRALLKSTAAINNDYTKRVSHPEPGMAPKAYYKDLITNFQKAVVEIIDQLAYLS